MRGTTLRTAPAGKFKIASSSTIPAINSTSLVLTTHHRRACPGVHVAEKSLFLVISRTLWGFNIQKKRRPDGSVIEPTTRMMPGFLSVPEPFECDITCRSKAHEKIIRSAFENANLEDLNFRS